MTHSCAIGQTTIGLHLECAIRTWRKAEIVVLGRTGDSSHARIQVFFLGGWKPPFCNFFLLVDLPRALQQFGSAPEIPVRTPPPPPF